MSLLVESADLAKAELPLIVQIIIGCAKSLFVRSSCHFICESNTRVVDQLSSFLTTNSLCAGAI
jgi:hypothetical protein